MSTTHDQSVLEALLDSWDRNNTILLNLLRALPESGLEARVMGGSPSVAELFKPEESRHAGLPTANRSPWHGIQKARGR
jgi:hypothetical protein